MPSLGLKIDPTLTGRVRVGMSSTNVEGHKIGSTAFCKVFIR